MARSETNSFASSALTYPVLAAKKFIAIFEQVQKPSSEQRALLAAAYYTLATEQNTSQNRSKMHVNSAIALLKNIQVKDRKENWKSQIAHAYFRRAEIQEDNDAFITATMDYQRTIEVLEHIKLNEIDDDDRLLLAQALISIADLVVNQQVDRKEMKLSHPLYYVNKALEYLAEMVSVDDDFFATHAYAHQIAGIALSYNHFDEAREAFQIALLMGFKSESSQICPLIADIYTCLSILYEQQYEKYPIQQASSEWLDHARIYFGLSLLFNPSEGDEKENDILALESLFELIYRVLDPFLPMISDKVTENLIDALIYAYMCIVDNVLPNQALNNQLRQPDTLDIFAQHIYSLVKVTFRTFNPMAGLLEITQPGDPLLALETCDILQRPQNALSDNVYYLEKNTLLS